ncbi:6741_t:CDS:2 [Funneliformis caledonium]|uniref:6741_t:CDS:1 n=1 Tax=Funneliformis caledonium TaxID=1117310 RepID=A0A9N8ZSM0_9GLOM|nr:6741_t:CDS:2 [Funneliformis caledonium]
MIKANLEEGVRETEGKRADIIHLTEEDIESKDDSSKSDRRSRKKHGCGRDSSTSTINSNNPNKGPSPTTVLTAHTTGFIILSSINVMRSDTNSIKKASIRNIKQRHKIEETIN